MAKRDQWLTSLPDDATVADAARVAIASRVESVVESLPLSLLSPGESPETVHRLRVTCRRASAVLRSYRDVFPEKQACKLATLLGRVRRAAGPARDLDVFILRLVERQAPESLIDRLWIQRRAAQGEIVRVSKKARSGKRLTRRAEKLARMTPTRGKKARRLSKTLLTDWAPRKLDKVIEKLAAASPAADASPEALHRFRIAGKRVRYTCEALAAGLPKEFLHTAGGRLRQLQDRLGRMNDHTAAAARMEKLLSDATEDGRDFLQGQILRERDELAQATRDFHEWWEGGEQLALLTALRVAC